MDTEKPYINRINLYSLRRRWYRDPNCRRVRVYSDATVGTPLPASTSEERTCRLDNDIVPRDPSEDRWGKLVVYEARPVWFIAGYTRLRVITLGSSEAPPL